jgi:molybdenum transport protein
MEWSSGIATSAAEIVASARRADPHAMLAGARKNTPGARRLTSEAFRAGGSVIHRLGLSETLLVFAEHRLFVDREKPAETVARLRRQRPETRVVVEVSTHEEALARADGDVLPLEKFTPDGVAEVAAALVAAGSTALVAAAGVVHAGSAEDDVRAGARLPVTSAPHFAKPCDVQVRFASDGGEAA